MTALSDAARAVEEAAETVLCDSNRASIAHLIAAVRHHDAEIVRTDTGHIRYGSATEYAIRHAALIDSASPTNRTANRIDPKETP